MKLHPPYLNSLPLKVNDTPQSQSGFSLVEILLVLGVIAVLAIAAFIIFPRVQAGTQATKEARNLRTIAAGIRGVYALSGNYSGVNELLINRARLLPLGMNGGNFNTTNIRTSWNEEIRVTNGAETAPGNSPTFIIIFRGMPSAVCTLMVPAIQSDFEKVTLTTENGGVIIKDIHSANPAFRKFRTAVMADVCARPGDWVSLTVESR